MGCNFFSQLQGKINLFMQMDKVRASAKNEKELKLLLQTIIYDRGGYQTNGSKYKKKKK